MKPKSKATGTRRFKLKRDEPLSSSGFKFNLRRYASAEEIAAGRAANQSGGGKGLAERAYHPDEVGWCRLTLSNPC
jgi:hypothetical protein